MTELYRAYAEYLERMLEESDELALVSSNTIPDWVNLPLFEEWAQAS